MAWVGVAEVDRPRAEQRESVSRLALLSFVPTVDQPEELIPFRSMGKVPWTRADKAASQVGYSVRALATVLKYRLLPEPLMIPSVMALPPFAKGGVSGAAADGGFLLLQVIGGHPAVAEKNGEASYPLCRNGFDGITPPHFRSLKCYVLPAILPKHS